MVADGEEVLVGAPKVRSVDELILSSGEQTYEASFSFFRNRASASRPDAGRSVQLSGSIAGRSYEIFFDNEDASALPVAVFSLWHLTMNRRLVYLTGTSSKGGKM